MKKKSLYFAVRNFFSNIAAAGRAILWMERREEAIGTLGFARFGDEARRSKKQLPAEAVWGIGPQHLSALLSGSGSVSPVLPGTSRNTDPGLRAATGIFPCVGAQPLCSGWATVAQIDEAAAAFLQKPAAGIYQPPVLQAPTQAFEPRRGLSPASVCKAVALVTPHPAAGFLLPHFDPRGPLEPHDRVKASKLSLPTSRGSNLPARVEGLGPFGEGCF